VPGKYASKGRNYSDYLELKTDGTFSLYEKTRTLDGTYVVQGTILTFNAKGKYQYYLKARLGPLNKLLVHGGGHPPTQTFFWKTRSLVRSVGEATVELASGCGRN
jgi:hypothetical protein